MVASSIDAVRAAIDQDDKLAAAFGRKFISIYAGTAFGVLPKTEIDLLVFSLLIEAKAIDPNGSIFRIARALNITPAKAKGLLFQHQLRTMSEDETDHAVMIALTTARYRKEGDNLAFGVHSPLIYAAIRAKMQEGGVFADVSLSGDILRVNPEQFGKVIATLMTPTQAKHLIDRLKKKKDLDEGKLRKAVERVGSDIAKEAVKKGGEIAVHHSFEALGELIQNGGGELLDHLLEII